MSELVITIDGVAYEVVAAGHDEEGDVIAVVLGPDGQRSVVTGSDMTDAEFAAVRSELWYESKFG